MSYNLDKFRSGLDKLNISLSEEQIQQFLTYYEMLVETNKVMNLTAITEFDEVIEKHFLDSLSLCRVYDLNQNIKVLDMGTGAGFPGIPLKIAFPEIDLVLADSLNKRIMFLQDVIDELGLKKVEAIHGRAEEMARNKQYREQFDLSVSRAVANLSSLSEYCIPFVKKDGYFVPYKSGKVEEELKQAESAVKKLGGEMHSVIMHLLPGTDVERTFIPVKKVGITAKKYPRKAGLPSKEPLK